MFALAVTLLFPIGTRSLAYQSPVPQSERAGTDESKLTAEEEKDSYAVYSMVLRTEMEHFAKTTTWAISKETQTFPYNGVKSFDDVRECMNVLQDQESIYLPLIEDYVAKNKTKQVLERKFDLPQYALILFGRPSIGPPLSPIVVLDVSAVGFNKDRTRSLVYVGHHCGSLCGGGEYHLLVKKDGKWQVDQEYRGMSCFWAS
jgi:hypothetical protein